MLQIKRYSNRKLYDTDNRRYITLPEIAKLLREGEEIQVIDHDSGTDLTTQIMLQALFSAERKLGGWLPPNPVARLLDAGEKNLQNFLVTLFGRVSFHQLVNQEILRRLDQLVSRGELPSQEAERLGGLLVNFSPPATEIETPSNTQRETLETLLADLERLSAILDELSTRSAE